ncbi:putative pectinesterase [Lupinus albus]|uniref:Pectinesterase n=1 Tax=Lupinus albus TaxID=3870 RepID=A0A6A4NL12_LUPAL|nr:putative pectinesterase [Lupinus albus]
MRDVLTKSMHMSSNALAIIYGLSKALSDLNASNVTAHALLQDSEDQQVFNHDELIPSWVDGDSAVRRLLHTSSHKLKPHVVVAKDGSGKFKRINEALKMVPKKNQKPFIIYIRKGVYHEYVEVTKQMTHVVFVGDGRNKTRITGNKNFIDGINTYRTSTVVIQGDYFVGMNMGFENSAGPHKHEAVAIRVQADKSIFYKCSFDGYQDTLYAHTHRQFYRDCTISGTIDFIFGDAIAVFQNCTFILRKPLKNQSCIVTAQGRKERYQPSGIVIQGGSIISSHEYHSVRFKNKTYLARPWKNYSRTIFMDTYIDDLVQCDGYVPRQGPKGTFSTKDTCFYADYNNIVLGSNKSKLVKCHGIKKLTKQKASSFLPSKFFHEDDWIKVTRIPYQSGMGCNKH